MPFTVFFNIYEPGKEGPCFTTTDAKLAKVEYNDRTSKPGMALTRMTYTIQLEDLTKHEEYVWLVYQVRRAIRKFFDGGRNHDDFLASMALEKQLDQWNVRTRTYLNNHPNAKVDEKSKAFFLLVEAWRDKWHKYFAVKKSKAEPEAVIKEMKKECEDYEAQIDKYTKQVIGLI
jgi:hypothetical protein